MAINLEPFPRFVFVSAASQKQAASASCWTQNSPRARRCASTPTVPARQPRTPAPPATNQMSRSSLRTTCSVPVSSSVRHSATFHLAADKKIVAEMWSQLNDSGGRGRGFHNWKIHHGRQGGGSDFMTLHQANAADGREQQSILGATSCNHQQQQ